MARDINDIQRDIERTRRQLAGTLDELVQRSNPNRLVGEVKSSATTKLQDPQVQKILLGVGVAVAGVVLLAVGRSRKKSKEMKELRELLVSRL